LNSAAGGSIGFDPGNTFAPPHTMLAPSVPEKKISDVAACLIWVNHDCEISTLDEKYLWLNGTVDPVTHEWHAKDRAKLDALVQAAELGARHGIAFAAKAEMDPAVLTLIYERASHDRSQGDDMTALEALRNYWRCALLGNMCWQLAHTRKAEPVDLGTTPPVDGGTKSDQTNTPTPAAPGSPTTSNTPPQSAGNTPTTSNAPPQTTAVTPTTSNTPTQTAAAAASSKNKPAPPPPKPAPTEVTTTNPAPTPAPAQASTSNSTTNSEANIPVAPIATNTDNPEIPVAPIAKAADLGDAGTSTTNTPPPTNAVPAQPSPPPAPAPSAPAAASGADTNSEANIPVAPVAKPEDYGDSTNAPPSTNAAPVIGPTPPAPANGAAKQ
jgi:hypothetical protein